MVTFQEIATRYLWGANEVPADKASPLHIRPDGPGSSVSVDLQEYFLNGPGRFATMEKFSIVQALLRNSRLRRDAPLPH